MEIAWTMNGKDVKENPRCKVRRTISNNFEISLRTYFIKLLPLSTDRERRQREYSQDTRRATSRRWRDSVHSIREWKRAVDQLRGRVEIESSNEESQRGFDSIPRKSKRETGQLQSQQLSTKNEEGRSSPRRASCASLEVVLVTSKIHAESQPVPFAREEEHPSKPVATRLEKGETGREEERSEREKILAQSYATGVQGTGRSSVVGRRGGEGDDVRGGATLRNDDLQVVGERRGNVGKGERS